MITYVVDKLIAWSENTGRTVHISGTADASDVYLIRHKIFKSNYFNFYIHEFLRSDRDDLHDHPWHFATFLVRGAYTERKWNDYNHQIESTRRTVSRKRLVLRKATDQHQVVVDKDLKIADRSEAAVTIFLSGPILREWGFIQDEQLEPRTKMFKRLECEMFGVPFVGTYRKWVPWRKYLGLPDDHPSR